MPSLALPWTDVVVTSTATAAAAYLGLVARWVPGGLTACAVFTAIAAGAPLLRWLALRLPRWRWLEVAASFWLLPSVIFAHGQMGPLIDAINPRLLDAQLALADLRLFGADPALSLGARTPGWLNDALLLCYYSYFLWPAALGLVLYRTRSRQTFELYTLALAMLFAANFMGYVLVPAVGPRYFFARQFAHPLAGVLAPWLESAMRTPTFNRDCFPSGHTATTLLVLSFAFPYARRFFWVMLPVGTGLVLATLVGRFHYGVDVLCAAPFMLAMRSIASTVARVHPRGLVLPLQGLPGRQPVRV